MEQSLKNASLPALSSSKKSKASRLRKKSFTLLEVVIAITLVALSAPLLFSLPFKLAKQQVDLLFETELQRVADVEWGKYQAKICTREIPWKEILKAENNALSLENQKCLISFAKGLKREYLLKKEIIEIKTKKIAADREGKLLKVKFSFRQNNEKKEISYIYQVCIQGRTPAKSTKNLNYSTMLAA